MKIFNFLSTIYNLVTSILYHKKIPILANFKNIIYYWIKIVNLCTVIIITLNAICQRVLYSEGAYQQEKNKNIMFSQSSAVKHGFHLALSRRYYFDVER